MRHSQEQKYVRPNVTLTEYPTDPTLPQLHGYDEVKRGLDLTLATLKTWQDFDKGREPIDHRELCDQLQLNQDTLVGHTTFKGSNALDEVVIRAAVINPNLTPSELHHLLDSIERAALQ